MSGHYYGQPLRVSVEDGHLVIAIGVQTLAHAVTCADWANPYDETRHDYICTFAVTDAAMFAKDVARELQREREDGSSPITDLLDKASEAALDDGSEACDYEQRIPYGTTAPSEIWAAPAVGEGQK